MLINIYVQPFCETTTHSPTMHLNSQHAEGDLLRYLGVPVDFSVIPYESEWNKIIYTL